METFFRRRNFGARILQRFGMLAVLFVAALTAFGLGFSSEAQAACDPPFVQVNENGFGSRFNLYSWSMKSFTSTTGNHLYVGTLATGLRGAEIWRYDGTTWRRVGFRNIANIGIRILMDYQGALYAGTANPLQGAQLWRTFNGTTWSRVMTGGFGDVTNTDIRTLREFNGYFYAGTESLTGAGKLWRSVNGTNWELVSGNGFGDPTNTGVYDLQVFNGQLYAGTINTTKGTQIWRSSDGVNFEVVVGDGAATPSGFGDPDTGSTFHMEIFNNQMYIGTGNFEDGFDLRRTSDGLTYEKIGASGFGYGDCAAYAWRFRVFEGRLWMNGLDLCNGGTVWRTSDGTNWEQIVGDVGIFPAGFGEESNWGTRSVEIYNNKLYFGTAECFLPECRPEWNGTEVWEWQGECTQ